MAFACIVQRRTTALLVCLSNTTSTPILENVLPVGRLFLDARHAKPLKIVLAVYRATTSPLIILAANALMFCNTV